MLCSYIVDRFNLTRLLLSKQNYFVVLPCYEIQLYQLSYLFSGYSSSFCIIHMQVHTIMPCLNASMFSCHQQFLFLQPLLCFLDAYIAFKFEYCC